MSLPCEYCDGRRETDRVDEWGIPECEPCAERRIDEATERELAKFHGGTDAWPYYLRGLA